MTNIDSIFKSRNITLPTKVYLVKAMFSSSDVWMWELDHKEGWALENWWFQIVVLQKTLESPFDYKEIKSVNPKGNKPWIFIRRIAAEAEAPILGPLDAKNWLIGKDPDAGKDWRQKEKGASEDDNITDAMNMSLSKLWEIVEDRWAWHAAVHGVTKRGLSDWTTATNYLVQCLLCSCEAGMIILTLQRETEAQRG